MAAPRVELITIGDELLKVHVSYGPLVQSLLKKFNRAGRPRVKGLAHITGGGFPDNIPRVLPKGFGARINLAAVPVLPVFKWLADAGGIAQNEMLRTFNMGVGLIVVVPADKFRKAQTLLTRAEEKFHVIGRIIKSDKNDKDGRKVHFAWALQHLSGWGFCFRAVGRIFWQ